MLSDTLSEIKNSLKEAINSCNIVLTVWNSSNILYAKNRIASALSLLENTEQLEFWELKPELIHTDKGWALGPIICKPCLKVDKCELRDAGKRRTYCINFEG